MVAQKGTQANVDYIRQHFPKVGKKLYLEVNVCTRDCAIISSSTFFFNMVASLLFV